MSYLSHFRETRIMIAAETDYELPAWEYYNLGFALHNEFYEGVHIPTGATLGPCLGVTDSKELMAEVVLKLHRIRTNWNFSGDQLSPEEMQVIVLCCEALSRQNALLPASAWEYKADLAIINPRNSS